MPLPPASSLIARLPTVLAAWRRRGLGLRLLLASLVVVCMVVMASAQLGINVWMGRGRFAQEAQNAAQKASVLIEERTRALLQPNAIVLRQIGFSPLAQATALDERLALRHVLTAELAANPLLAAAYIGYRDGDFLLARPLRSNAQRQGFEAPPAAAYLLQSMQGGQGRYHFVDAGGALLGSRDEAGYRFDPRQRPWFRAAEGQEALVVGDPYLFFTTQEVGLTLSQRSRDGAAVVGVDLLLVDLSRTLAGQRLTKGSQLALLNSEQRVLAYSEPARLVSPQRGQVQLAELDGLQQPALTTLPALAPSQAHVLRLADGEWIGLRVPFEVGLGPGLQLLAVTPMEDLVAPARARAHRARWIAAGLALLLLPVGWWAGSTIARALDRLSARTQRLVRFDFGGRRSPHSLVREVNELNQAIEHMGGTIEAFLRLSEQMATEPEVERMLQQVLEQLTQATQSTAAAVFLWDEAAQQMQRAAQSGTLAFAIADRFDYPTERGSRQGARAFGPTLRHLDLELRGRDARLKGLLVLEFVGDDGHADPAFLRFARQMSGMLAVAIETRQLIDAQRKLFDAVIQLMADAIDAKSPYTGGHCERVPQLAIELLDRLCAEREGRYASFSLSDTERYAFRLGAWLHDCGKVTSPEHIVDKATKLELIHNRIHEIRTRFELLWRDAELAHLRGELDAAQLAARRAQLQDDWTFVAQCNVGGEFLSDEAIARLRAIGAQTWQRHFDDRLGLSAAEAQRLAAARPTAPPLPATETLLADKPEHRVPWDAEPPPVRRDDPRNHYGFDMQLPAQQQHQGELHNLSIRRGTLSDEDRFKINEHIVQTYIMLKGLPWPAGLERVPEYAATHHEKLDGRGYPRQLPAEQLGLPDRVMALADVFEALTAADRPYKPAKTLTETLALMAMMCKDRHLDAELFRYFLKSRLWERFAERFLKPEQRDEVDLAAIEALLPPAS